MSDIERLPGNERPSEPADFGPRIWVLASGPVSDPELTVRGLPPPDIVISADGGSSLAARLGLVPALIIGDLDSSEHDVVSGFEALGVEVRRYEHHTKSETDMELAVFAALDLQPVEIILLGALGGRLDHSLANVLLLTNPLLASARVRIVGRDETIFLIRPGGWTNVEGEPGVTVSLLPIGGKAFGISLDGFEYPLDNEDIPLGAARGVSNRLMKEHARIRLTDGMLLVILSRSSTQDGKES